MNSDFHTDELGKSVIHKIVGLYDIALGVKWPFAQYTVKVIQLGDDEYKAIPNVFVFNSKTNCIEYVCGLGSTPMESVLDAIQMTTNEAIRQALNRPDNELHKSDFRWFNWKPFQTDMPLGYLE